jgi:hypothetical protein
LLLAAIGQALIYAAFVVFFSILGPGGHVILRQLFIWPALLALTFLYHRSYRIVTGEPSIPAGVIVLCGAGFGMLALFIPPFHSTDLYGYVNYGWMQSHYHLNPYVKVVVEIPGWRRDPMLTGTGWEYLPCPYGFLLAFLARIVCELGRGDLPLTLTLFKILNLAGLAATGWLAFLCTRRLHLSCSLALCLILWSPLLLLHHIANGHNDILAAFFTMAAIYSALVQVWIAVIPFVAAAALIKYPCAVAVPFAIAFVIRRAGTARALAGIFAGGLVLLASASPYIGDVSNFKLHAAAGDLLYTANSLESVPFYLYGVFVRLFPSLRATLPAANLFFKSVIWFAAGAILLVQILRFTIDPNPVARDFIAAVLFAEMLVIVVASSKFYPWYIGMFFPLGMLLDADHWLSRLTVAISLWELLAFTFIGQAHILNYLTMVVLPAAFIMRDRRDEVIAGVLGDWSRTGPLAVQSPERQGRLW